MIRVSRVPCAPIHRPLTSIGNLGRAFKQQMLLNVPMGVGHAIGGHCARYRHEIGVAIGCKPVQCPRQSRDARGREGDVDGGKKC
jgi:hypothetical protein